MSRKTGVEKHSPTIINYSSGSLNSSAVLSNKLNVFKRATTQNQSRNRTAQTKWTKHGHMRLWISDVALNHDIEPNSGPTAKPKCSSCNKTVRKNQAAILCKGCKRNYHASVWGYEGTTLKNFTTFKQTGNV